MPLTGYSDVRAVRCVGRSVDIAMRHRDSGDHLVIFLHGLACGKESFDGAFDSPLLARFSLCAIDFPGHGESPRDPAGRSGLRSYAEIVAAVIDQLSPGTVSIVGHSMGGSVGLVACEIIGPPITYVSIEGNLTGADCGLISRGIAEQSNTEFLGAGLRALLDRLSQSTARDLRTWGRWCARCDPQTIHSSARSLVEWSDSGKLVALLHTLPRVGFVYGTESLTPDRQMCDVLAGAEIRPIPGSGHFPMIDAPSRLYRTLAQLLRG